MKVKLYIDNDSRPRGSFENVASALVRPDRIDFITFSGKQFMTNLRYLVEIEPGDNPSPASIDHSQQITGRPKPPKSASAKQMELGKHEVDDFDD